MALQTFTAGQVLTAAQVNALQANDFNQTVSTKTADYVLVAADKGTRVEMNSGSATTITVDTDLFNAGDTLFIQNRGAGVCTITAGTATVSTAGSLALVENAGGTLYFISAGVAVFYASGVAAASGALTLISATTVGTAVTSVTVNDAFSATYDNYFITYNGGTSSATNNLELRLGATTTGYYWNIVGNTWSPTASNTGGTNSSAFAYTGGHDSTNGPNSQITVQSPFLAKRTVVQSQHVSTTGGYSMNGMLDNTTSYTSFILLAGSGNLTGGTIRVYGYKNS